MVQKSPEKHPNNLKVNSKVTVYQYQITSSINVRARVDFKENTTVGKKTNCIVTKNLRECPVASRDKN